MIKKELLHTLIHSLSKSEKRYFKLFCTREKSGRNYLRLFDAIASQKTYDEKIIRKQFQGENFIKQLHTTKGYLHALILKSLRNFHAGMSKDARLKSLLRNIEILYHKELFAACETEISRAENLARKSELTTGLLEVQSWKRKIAQIQTPSDYASLTTILSEQADTLAKLKNTHDYWQLAVAVSSQIFEGTKEKIKNYHLLKDPATASSLEAKVLYYNTTYLQHFVNDRSAKAEKELRTLLHILEGNPMRLKEEPGHYVSSINNLVSFLVFHKKYKDAILLIQKAKTTYKGWQVTSENRTLLKQMVRTYNLELEIYRSTKDFTDQDAFIESTASFVKTSGHKLPKEYVASFQFQLASIYFMRNELSKALHWINRLLNSRDKSVRTDLRVQMHILNLMVHLEQKNFMVLSYYTNSAKRFMNKIRKIQPYEKVLLKFFIGIGSIPLLEHKAAFERLKTQLYPNKETSLVPEDLEGYIDYKAWIERLLKNA